jgi:hypothetical protein
MNTFTRRIRVFPVRQNAVGLLLSGIFCLSGCGGGGGGGGGNPPPQPDFTLGLNPTTVSVTAGGAGTTSVTVNALNGFSSQVSVQIAGLPNGVIATPASFTLSPGNSQAVTLSAAAGSSAVTATVTFTGAASGLQHSAPLSLTIAAGGGGRFTSTRTKYVRTDAVTEYYLWVNSHWVVYHTPTSRYFVTDPFSNSVFVMDSVNRTKIGTIAVPGAYGIDEAPDQSSIYVGTLIGDVYVIDPVGMRIKKRYIASEIGPYGYQAIIALALSDGRLALLGQQGGIPSVDGSSSVAIWNPGDNSITIYGSPNTLVPSSPLCGVSLGLHIFGFGLTSDRTTLLVGDGALCELNAITGQSNSASFSANTGVIVTSPDGKYIALPSFPTTILLIDPKTLNQVAQINLPSDPNLQVSVASLTFSPDSQTIYVGGDTIVYAFNVATQQLIGWLPNIVVTYTSGGLAVGPIYNPNYEVMDNNGILVGPQEEGFGFLDTTQLRTGTVGSQFLNNYLSPATGPVTGGTPVQLSAPNTVNYVLIGPNQASSLSNSGTLLTMTTPPGNPGPADVYVFASDGGMQLIAEGFSYGPTILEVAPSLSTAEGGGAGVIYGYGFVSAGATKIPTDLSVSVGGTKVTIVGFNPNTYNVSGQPFLLQSLYYTIPPGVPGNAADVSVTTSAGTAVAKAALNYLPALKQFPLPGASLMQGIYDPIRDLYYFTDTTKIQVFSLSQGKWLAPISIPAPSGTTQKLWGIALSADGTKLAVADSQAGVIYLVDPANPSSIKTFPVKPAQATTGVLVLPAGVAISNSGMVYMVVDVQGGTGYHNYYTLDTNTGALTDLGIDGPGLGSSDLYLRLAFSADGARVFFNNDGYVFNIDTATGTLVSASVDSVCCYGNYDLALAPNQTQFAASNYLYDTNLNASSTVELNDREIKDASYVYGTKFSPDGTLLFQPATQGMDVYDGRLGTFLSRIAFSVPLSTNYDALVSDGKDNILIAITGTSGNGIAVIDLASVPEPGPLPYSAQATSQAVRTPSSDSAKRNPANSMQRKTTSVPQRRVVPHVTNPDLLHLSK